MGGRLAVSRSAHTGTCRIMKLQKKVWIHARHDQCSVRTMRRLLAPLAIFVLGCGAGRGNNGSPQAHQDAAVASLDSGPYPTLPPNTPAPAAAEAPSEI